MKSLCGLIAFLALSSCSMPSAHKRLDIEVTNTTEAALSIQVGSGIFSRKIELSPGATFRGWADPRLAGQKITVEIKAKE